MAVERRDDIERLTRLETTQTILVDGLKDMDKKVDTLLDMAAEARGAGKAAKLIAHGVTGAIGLAGGFLGSLIHVLPK